MPRRLCLFALPITVVTGRLLPSSEVTLCWRFRNYSFLVSELCEVLIRCGEIQQLMTDPKQRVSLG